ncbi:MAG: hypothetical protein OES26_08180 [Gammaproteobacteria bacterium]|nr:hypothetical protein [Gammaproteobacteria bacterium]
MTRATIITSAVFTTCLLATSAYAAPVSLSDAQMDSVAAGGVDTVDGFVCPVIGTDAVLNSPKGIGPLAEGDYSIAGPEVTVPVTATNGDGTGNPGVSYSQPGESDYTAIWGVRP